MLNSASAYAIPLGEVNFSECEAITERTLRNDLNRLVQSFFLDKTQFDFEGIVKKQWDVLNINLVIDSEVDKATSIVSRETGLLSKFKGNWWPNAAKILAEEVTSTAFNSPTFKKELYKLSNQIASELSIKIEDISTQSSVLALNCTQKFITKQYSQTFAEVFDRKIKKSVPNPIAIDKPLISDNIMISQHKFGIGGIATIITAQISKRIAGEILERITVSITQRLLGRVASVSIPFFGEVIGGGLVLYDVLKGFNGPLPEIQNSLKSLKTKSTLRSEIASIVEQELRNESPQIAQAISSDVYARWIEFQKQYKEVLSLAKEIPEFKETLTTYGLSKVSSLIGVALPNVDRSQIEQAIRNGQFERVLSLPSRSSDILTTSHDFSKIIDWADLAGNKIDDVVEFELYKYLNPDELDRRTLNSLLLIRDRSTISNLAMLDIQSIRSLLKISSHNLREIIANFSQKDLIQLAEYIDRFGAEKVNQTIQFLLVNDPTEIRNNRVVYDIISSKDINDSIKFWREPLFLTSVPLGILGVLEGTISWHLFTDKYEYALVVMFLLAGVGILLGILLGFRILPIFKSITSSGLSVIKQQFVKQAEPNEKQAEPNAKQAENGEKKKKL